MVSKIFSRLISFFKPSVVMLLAGICLIVFFDYYIFKLNLITRLVDENSHLNISRMVWDSLTPGISQLGFWPPLIHILIAPFTFSDFLFKTGLSGTIVSGLCFLFSGFFFYKLLFRLTGSKWLSAGGVLVFSTNPYILYYSSVPMMEMLFICNLLGTTYFLFRWIESENLRYLVATSLFVSLTSISRFEGLILVPLVGAILLINLIRKKRSYSEMEATSIIYAMIASLGILLILSYGWIFGGNPLAFANSQWSAFSQQRDYFLPTEHNVSVSLQYLLHSAYYMIGKWQIFVAIVSLILACLLAPMFELFVTVMLLVSPFLFDWLALFQGNIIIYVADLPPYNVFFNERYGLYSACLVAFAPIALIGVCKAKFHNKIISTFFKFVAPLSFASLAFLQGTFLYATAWTNRFNIIAISAQGYPSEDQKIVARALDERYDGGKILITRALHDFVTVNAGISLKNYIQEANFRFYDQAIEKPWLFARWVIMYDISENNDASLDWARTNEKVSAKWGGSEEFLKYYVPVANNKSEVLFKINEDVVRKEVISLGMDPIRVPSLNIEIGSWDPENIYNQMRDGH